MCDFKVWSRTDDNVFVMQCTHCNFYQIRMNHLCLIYSDDDYRKFQDYINDAFEMLQSGEKDMFVIPTLNGEMNILLNKAELKKMFMLMDSADTEIQAARLASMFF